MDYCPTQGGTFRAYAPEVLHEGEWTAIPIRVVGSNGVPYPALFGGVAQAIGLCGYSQAMCLAYGYAAVQEAKGHKCDVRVQEYAVEYDIKARKIDATQTTKQESQAMTDAKAYQATPHGTLLKQLRDSRVPKTEREHAAAKEIEQLRADLISCRGTVKTELNHYERLAGVHGKTPHGAAYEAEAQRLDALLDRIDAMMKDKP